MFKIAICDDEGHFRRQIQDILIQYMDEKGILFEISEFKSGKDFINLGIGINSYQIVFLDINMEELDGMETAKAIRQASPDVSIVFVTAYITWAPEGYKVGAVRYLLKEQRGLEGTLYECLDAVTDGMRRRQAKYEVDFPQGKRHILLDSVLYVESRLHRVLFYVMEDRIREYYKYGRLDVVEQELRQYGFIRVHQSFLVNLKYVKNVQRYTVSLKDGLSVNISKRYYKDVEKEYIRKQGEL